MCSIITSTRDDHLADSTGLDSKNRASALPKYRSLATKERQQEVAPLLQEFACTSKSGSRCLTYMGVDVVHYGVLVGLCPLPQHHVRLGHFAAPLVRHLHHARVRHGRVSYEQALELRRRHLDGSNVWR